MFGKFLDRVFGGWPGCLSGGGSPADVAAQSLLEAGWRPPDHGLFQNSGKGPETDRVAIPSPPAPWPWCYGSGIVTHDASRRPLSYFDANASGHLSGAYVVKYSLFSGQAAVLGRIQSGREQTYYHLREGNFRLPNGEWIRPYLDEEGRLNMKGCSGQGGPPMRVVSGQLIRPCTDDQRSFDNLAAGLSVQDASNAIVVDLTRKGS